NGARKPRLSRWNDFFRGLHYFEGKDLKNSPSLGGRGKGEGRNTSYPSSIKEPGYNLTERENS
ncbi:MAG TPA: hypothetical protein ACFYD1_03470, partial [Candidatus Hypogeohydataceae bacterium YC38]